MTAAMMKKQEGTSRGASYTKTEKDSTSETRGATQASACVEQCRHADNQLEIECLAFRLHDETLLFISTYTHMAAAWVRLPLSLFSCYRRSCLIKPVPHVACVPLSSLTKAPCYLPSAVRIFCCMTKITPSSIWRLFSSTSLSESVFVCKNSTLRSMNFFASFTLCSTK